MSSSSPGENSSARDMKDGEVDTEKAESLIEREEHELSFKVPTLWDELKKYCTYAYEIVVPFWIIVLLISATLQGAALSLAYIVVALYPFYALSLLFLKLNEYMCREVLYYSFFSYKLIIDFKNRPWYLLPSVYLNVVYGVMVVVTLSLTITDSGTRNASVVSAVLQTSIMICVFVDINNMEKQLLGFNTLVEKSMVEPSGQERILKVVSQKFKRILSNDKTKHSIPCFDEGVYSEIISQLSKFEVVHESRLRTYTLATLQTYKDNKDRQYLLSSLHPKSIFLRGEDPKLIYPDSFVGQIPHRFRSLYWAWFYVRELTNVLQDAETQETATTDQGSRSCLQKMLFDMKLSICLKNFKRIRLWCKIFTCSCFLVVIGMEVYAGYLFSDI